LNQVAEFHRKIGGAVAQASRPLDHDADLDRNLAGSLSQIVNSSTAATIRKRS
jgi:hypothetical protein